MSTRERSRPCARRAEARPLFRPRSLALIGALLMTCVTIRTQAADLDTYQGLNPEPTFELQDLGKQSRRLADYRGKVVLVNFWASWCPSCVVEMPTLQRLQNAMAGKPFTVLAVDVGESAAKVWSFTSRLDLHFPVLLDPEGDTASDWQVDTYPSSFLIDAKGVVRYVAVGERHWDDPGILQTVRTLIEPSKQPSSPSP